MPKQPEFHKYLPLEEARLGWMWGAPQVTEVDLGPHVGHSRVDHRWLVVSCRQDILPCVMMTVICVRCST